MSLDVIAKLEADISAAKAEVALCEAQLAAAETRLAKLISAREVFASYRSGEVVGEEPLRKATLADRIEQALSTKGPATPVEIRQRLSEAGVRHDPGGHQHHPVAHEGRATRDKRVGALAGVGAFRVGVGSGGSGQLAITRTCAVPFGRRRQVLRSQSFWTRRRSTFPAAGPALPQAPPARSSRIYWPPTKVRPSA